MKYAVIVGLVALTLAGCSAKPPADEVYAVSATEAGAGVGIQWNAQYVVTAGNMAPEGASPEFECSGCDLQFVRHASSRMPAQWRDVVDDEPLALKAVEVEQGKSRITLARGRDADISVAGGARNQIRVAQMGDATGLPGSPLYGADGKVIGMHVEMLQLRVIDGFVFDESGIYQGVLEGDYDPSIEGQLLDYSVYLPYALIREQWAIFQSKRMRMAMLD